MSQGPLCPNLTKKSKRKCPKWPIVNCHALCYIGGLSVNLNLLKIGTFSLEFNGQVLVRQD